MANLVITAANVVPGGGAGIVTGTAGATITAGQALYLDPADNRYKLADCDAAAAEARVCAGIALNSAAAGQPVALVSSGPVSLGAVMTAGVTYYLSPTAGAICPVADVLSGDYTVILGMATSTSVLAVNIQHSGVALA